MSKVKPTPDRAMQAKLKKAREEVEAVFKKYDVAGFAVLTAPGWAEVFWNIWPSYSILYGDFPNIVVKSKGVDYGGDIKRQLEDQCNTAQMIHGIGVALGQYGMQFLELATILDKQMNAKHEDLDFFPDPSKSNPGTH